MAWNGIRRVGVEPEYISAAASGIAGSVINQTGQKDVARIQGRTAEHVAAMQAGASQGQNRSSENIAAMQAASQREAINATMMNNDKAREFNKWMQQDSQENNKIIVQLGRDAQDARDTKNWDRADTIAAEKRTYETKEALIERTHQLTMFSGMLKMLENGEKQSGDSRKAYNSAKETYDVIQAKSKAVLGMKEATKRSLNPVLKRITDSVTTGGGISAETVAKDAEGNYITGEPAPGQIDSAMEQLNNNIGDSVSKLTDNRIDYNEVRLNPSIIKDKLKSGEITATDVGALVMTLEIAAEQLETIRDTSTGRLPEGVTPGQQYPSPVSDKAGTNKPGQGKLMRPLSWLTGAYMWAPENFKYPRDYRGEGDPYDNPETRASMQAFAAAKLSKEVDGLYTKLNTIAVTFTDSNDPKLQAMGKQGFELANMSSGKFENTMGAILKEAMDDDTRSLDYSVLRTMMKGFMGEITSGFEEIGEHDMAAKVAEQMGLQTLTPEEYELLPTN